MTKIHFMNLSEEAIKSLKKIAAIKKYTESTPLHYQGQTPIVAYLILKGNILLLKKREIYHKLSKGCMVGYRELCSNTPSKFTAEVLANTEICYIDKSTLLEISHSKNSEFCQLYKELKNLML
jgi:CRP-like cAMP-binding protein